MACNGRYVHLQTNKQTRIILFYIWLFVSFIRSRKKNYQVLFNMVEKRAKARKAGEEKDWKSPKEGGKLSQTDKKKRKSAKKNDDGVAAPKDRRVPLAEAPSTRTVVNETKKPIKIKQHSPGPRSRSQLRREMAAFLPDPEEVKTTTRRKPDGATTTVATATATTTGAATTGAAGDVPKHGLRDLSPRFAFTVFVTGFCSAFQHGYQGQRTS